MMEKTKILGGKYQIISEIKKGGFGIVYYGFDKNLGKAVAIKEIAPELLEEAKYIDLFQAEARNAAKLNHHNIVHIFDLLKTPEGHFYIIMEYIDGVDLHKILKKSKQLNKKLSINLATYIIGEVCKALEYAHNRKDVLTGEPLNLIHQDISPSNIMVSMKGDVKLIDFGIARVRHEQKIRPRDKVQVTGKLPYMSPEQLNGGFLIDGRSDIFSLSTVFFELVTGKRLFHGKSDEDIVTRIQSGKYDLSPLKELQIPEALQHIISRALQYDIEQRYQSANQMYLDLAQYLMVASKTIELSEELGEYVKGLFDVNMLNESDNGTDSQPDNQPEPAADDLPQKINLNLFEDETLALAEPDVFAKNLAEEFDLNIKKSKEKPSEKSINENDLLDLNNIALAENETESRPDFNSTEQEANEEPWDIREFDSPDISPPADAEIPLELDLNLMTEPPSEVPAQKMSPEKTPATEEPKKTSRTAEEEPSRPQMPVSDSFAPQAIFASASPESDDEEGEDDVKTVIDIVRLASRSYKKQILLGLGGIGAFLLLFVVIDTFARWTGMGKGIYNFLFPPAIKIVSYPPEAQVYLDDELLEGKTPISIQNIAPGVHKLKLVHPEYLPILKSINVPQKGEIEIEGTKKARGSNAYVFRFMTTIIIQSIPSSATVQVNDIRLNQLTPCEIQWEVGKPLTIEMEREGFQRLTGFTFNVLDLDEDMTERRFWKISKESDSKNNSTICYQIIGSFRKMVQVQSFPTGANIYVDDSPKPVGQTGSNGIIYLTIGEHEILIKKNGFIPQTVNVFVDEASTSKINIILQRRVQFHSKDIATTSNDDLGARLVRLVSKGRTYNYNMQTPFEINLGAISYEAVFKKDGYAEAVVQISQEQRVVVVQMEPDKTPIEIVVTDAISGEPIPNVQIYFRRLNEPNSNEQLFDVTNLSGRAQKLISHGQYIFKVTKDGYFQRRTNYTTNNKGANKIRFNLVAQ